MWNQCETYGELLQSLDEGYELCCQYDSMPHQYGKEILYQSEMHFLQAVAVKHFGKPTFNAQQCGHAW